MKTITPQLQFSVSWHTSSSTILAQLQHLLTTPSAADVVHTGLSASAPLRPHAAHTPVVPCTRLTQVIYKTEVFRDTEVDPRYISDQQLGAVPHGLSPLGVARLT